MNINYKIKKIILEYYKQPRQYEDLHRKFFDLHEELINNGKLIVKSPGVYKTNILIEEEINK